MAIESSGQNNRRVTDNPAQAHTQTYIYKRLFVRCFPVERLPKRSAPVFNTGLRSPESGGLSCLAGMNQAVYQFLPEILAAGLVKSNIIFQDAAGPFGFLFVVIHRARHDLSADPSQRLFCHRTSRFW